jgi:hypothetical protein
VEAIRSPPRHTNNQGVGPGHQVSILLDKHLKYCNNITTALSAPRGVTSFADFRKIHGQVQYVSLVIPCMSS